MNPATDHDIHQDFFGLRAANKMDPLVLIEVHGIFTSFSVIGHWRCWRGDTGAAILCLWQLLDLKEYHNFTNYFEKVFIGSAV